MKLLADECCDARLVAGLRSDGHDVLYVTEFARGKERRPMTVGELIAMLEEFPTDLPAYFCTDSAGYAGEHRVIPPLDAVMNLVHPGRGEAMAFSQAGNELYGTVPDGYLDALVIYPVSVRETM